MGMRIPGRVMKAIKGLEYPRIDKDHLIPYYLLMEISVSE